jgi:hypothetical protein
MLRRVALVRTTFRRNSSFIRVTRIGELGTTLAVTSNRSTRMPHIASVQGMYALYRRDFQPLLEGQMNSLRSDFLKCLPETAEVPLTSCLTPTFHYLRGLRVVSGGDCVCSCFPLGIAERLKITKSDSHAAHHVAHAWDLRQALECRNSGWKLHGKKLFVDVLLL